MRFLSIGLLATIAACASAEVNLVSVLNGRCLSIEGGTARANAGLVASTCKDGLHQSFVYTPQREFRIGKYCVAAVPVAAGTAVRLAECSGDESQKWMVEGEFIHPASNSSINLGIAGAVLDEGGTVILTNARAVPEQRWWPRGSLRALRRLRAEADKAHHDANKLIKAWETEIRSIAALAFMHDNYALSHRAETVNGFVASLRRIVTGNYRRLTANIENVEKSATEDDILAEIVKTRDFLMNTSKAVENVRAEVELLRRARF